MMIPLAALVLLEIAGSVYASSADGDKGVDYYKLYDTALGKRAAYSYVSEYKRLPVYNFGLGKRSPGDERRYSFGVGKRSDEADMEYDDDVKDEYSKRLKPYSFGLRKRASAKQYSFGLGKRPDGKMYSFGLGKRLPYDYENQLPHNYDYDENSEDVKRGGNENGHRFSFGLGKRVNEDEPRQGRSMMYNFGLGKRSDATKIDKDASSPTLVK